MMTMGLERVARVTGVTMKPSQAHGHQFPLPLYILLVYPPLLLVYPLLLRLKHLMFLRH